MARFLLGTLLRMGMHTRIDRRVGKGLGQTFWPPFASRR
jgi:hypothetical protein